MDIRQAVILASVVEALLAEGTIWAVIGRCPHCDTPVIAQSGVTEIVCQYCWHGPFSMPQH
jgi:hypothetical protein